MFTSSRRQRPRGLGACTARGHHDAAPTAAVKHERLGLATILHGLRPTLGEVLRAPALVEVPSTSRVSEAVEIQVPD